MSHPAWVCGLKQYFNTFLYSIIEVTPCVGVWIETLTGISIVKNAPVTPCVGVWIETKNTNVLKNIEYVTPCVGVWIETIKEENDFVELKSHTLRGCVD